MRQFSFVTVFCLFICSGNAQISISKETEAFKKTNTLKSANVFLSQKAAFDLYRKLSKSNIPAPPAAVNTPQTYTFVWPQMTDGANTLYFEGPIPYLNNQVVCLTSGVIDIQIPGCTAPGFYLLQLNCSFQNSGAPQMKVNAYDRLLVSTQPPMSVTMEVAAPFQKTTFVFGVNLVQGMNELTIQCPNNTWYFHSLKIAPLQ